MSKKHRLVLFIVFCSGVGVVLGGTASQAQSDHCLQTAVPTLDCLTQPPATKILEGMSTGLVAGTGAGIGATWRMWRQD